MIALLKSLHIVALLLWCGALLVMPFVLSRGARVAAQSEFDAYRRSIFWGYVALMSPAAVTAIASGTALAFLRDTFTVWFMVKLAAVGLMVVAHAWIGHAVARTGEAGGNYRPPPAWLLLGMGMAGMSLVLVMVLGKPELRAPAVFDAIAEPRQQELWLPFPNVVSPAPAPAPAAGAGSGQAPTAPIAPAPGTPR